MDLLAAIPTTYHGIKYRSRAEARWAMFLENIGLEFRYEDEGYQLPSFWYLPDFWFPTWRAFGEVEGGLSQWDQEATIKAVELAMGSTRPVLLFDEISPLDPYIRVIAPDGMELYCDFPSSLLRGRVWYETEKLADRMHSIGDDHLWGVTAINAANYQFRTPRNVRERIRP